MTLPVHLRDDFLPRNGRYVSRSLCSYPNGEETRALNFQEALHFMAGIEALHTGENRSRLRPPLLDEYLSLNRKKAEASDHYEWLGHILVPSGAALIGELNDERLVLSGIRKSSAMQLVNSVTVHKDGKTTVLEADPSVTYELDFRLPENNGCGTYVVNKGLIDPKTGFLERGVRIDKRGDEPLDGFLTAAMEFVPLKPYVVRVRGRCDMYLDCLEPGYNSSWFRFASSIDPNTFIKTGEESLKLVQSKAGEALRDRIASLRERIRTVQRVDPGATIAGRHLEVELEELGEISRRYFPVQELEGVETVSA